MTTVEDYKSVFISDTHLGFKGAKAKPLNNFLTNHHSDNLYLVGDIIDGWRLQKKFFWPEQHTQAIKHILAKSNNGTKVHYLIGNHDEAITNLKNMGLQFGKIKFHTQMDHHGVDGKKYLVCHGDMFDSLMNSNLGKSIMFLGSSLYDLMLDINTFINVIARKSNMPYVNLTGFAKNKTKSACNYLLKFENLLSQYANSKRYDGVICGHIHSPEIKSISDTIYMNCGDWVENCSALVEHHDGRWEILKWGRSSD